MTFQKIGAVWKAYTKHKMPYLKGHIMINGKKENIVLMPFIRDKEDYNKDPSRDPAYTIKIGIPDEDGLSSGDGVGRAQADNSGGSIPPKANNSQGYTPKDNLHADAKDLDPDRAHQKEFRKQASFNDWPTDRSYRG